MMRSFLQRFALVLAAAAGLLGTRPATANAQKALVYCPVTVDATGCNAIVTALTGTFPLGVDRGYDGTGGTVDLKAVDLFSYSVFVVPSLADGSGSQPYAMLRDPDVVGHLKAALIGRIAMWSGTPDQGATNRAMKDALIQNLAGWAAGAYATAKGPGLVTFLDASASAVTRYDWVRAIAPLPVTADANLLIYNSVRALNQRATSILTSGAGPISYTNMATYGFQLPNGAPGVSLDAVGQTGTSVGGQVVLLTMEAGNSTGATVKTDKDDYAPGETVTMTGAGWQPGEQIKLTLHMDPLRDTDTELTATANGSGTFTNTDFAPAAYDVGVRFVLTALGQSSGRRAQATFTDGNKASFATTAAGAEISSFGTVAANQCVSAFVQERLGGNLDVAPAGGRSVALSSTAVGATFFSGSTCSGSAVSSVTIPAGQSATEFSFTLTTVGSQTINGNGGFSGSNNASASITVSAPAAIATTLTLAAPSPASVPFASSNAITFSATLTRTSGGAAVSGATVDFKVDASSVGTAVTNASGVATLSTYNPSALTVGGHSVQASFGPQTISGTSYSASTSGTQTLTVTKANQTITFGPLADKTFGEAPFTVSATASSGLTVSFAASGNCSVAGTTVSITGAGSCTITASQAGNGNYNAAADVPQTFSIAKANQTINFAALPDKNFGDAPFTVSATASSGLTVSFAVGGADNCTIVGTQVTLTGAGSCTVTASQAGDANYNAAVPVPQSFSIGKANQTIAFAALPNKTFGDVPFAVSATATSGLAVSFAVGATDNCTIAGDMVTITGAGTCTVTASQAGNANYNAAPDVPQTFSINKAAATITIDAATLTQTYNGTPRVVTATTSPVGLTVLTITYDGSTTPPMNAGSYAIVASLTNANYAAPNATGTLNVAKATQTITFGALANKTFGDAPFNVSATASSGLVVTFTATGNCSVVGTQVTITGAGSCEITANQAGNNNYEAAPAVSQSFTIAKFTPTVVATGGTFPYDAQPHAATATVTGANGATLTVPAATFTYAKQPGGAPTATVPVDAGTYAVVASYAGDANYNAASSSNAANIVIEPATPTINWSNPADIVYGTALGSTQLNATATGVANVTVPGTFSYTPPSGTILNAGDGQVLSVSFTSSDPNYKNVPVTTVTINVKKATPTVSVTGGTFDYDAQPHPATGSVTGVLNESLGTPTFTYNGSSTAPTDAGTYNVVASFAGNTNYNQASATATITINKITPVFSNLSSPTITYGDLTTAIGGKLAAGTLYPPGSVSITINSVTQSAAIDPANGTFSANFATGALGVANSPYTISYSYTTSTNFNGASDNTKTLTVQKATPVVTATGGTFEYDALAHPATASVAGVNGAVLTVPAVTFTYNGLAAEPVNAGNYAVVASYAGDANYNAATGTTSIVITPATPTITWNNPANITYGTLLGATQLNATATGVGGVTVAGSFAYDPAAGTLLNAGPNQTLKTDFTSSDPNYKNVLGTTVQITVEKYTPSIVATGLSTTYDALPHPATATVTGINGTILTVPPTTFTYAKEPGGAPDATVPVNAGTYAVVATYAGDANYNAVVSTNDAKVVIAKATPVFTNLASPSIVYGATPTALGGKVASGSLYPTGNVSITVNGVTQQAAIASATGLFSSNFTTNLLGVNTYPIVYSYAGDENFNAVSPNGAGTLTVTKAPLEIAFTPLTATFGVTADFPPAFTITPTGFVNGENVGVLGGTLAFSPAASTYNAATFAGAYTITPSGYTSNNYAITFKSGTFTIVDATKPVVSNTLANPVPINVAGTVTATISDETTGHSNIASAQYSVDGGAWVPMSGPFNTTFKINVTAALPAFATTGVHVVCVRGTDAANNTSELECVLLAVYDPSAGFVTGGGWISSPTGAYPADPALSGKATFGFVSKYKKGATAPEGNTEFQFHAGSFNFKSTSYEWLVVAGARAQFKGVGTVNGAGTFGFILTAVDGQVSGGGGTDRFRMKVWNISTGAIVYDNQIGADDTAVLNTTLGGGSINIQAK